MLQFAFAWSLIHFPLYLSNIKEAGVPHPYECMICLMINSRSRLPNFQHFFFIFSQLYWEFFRPHFQPTTQRIVCSLLHSTSSSSPFSDSFLQCYVFVFLSVSAGTSQMSSQCMFLKKKKNIIQAKLNLIYSI